MKKEKKEVEKTQNSGEPVDNQPTTPQKRKHIWRRKYIHEVSLSNDIKYRPPLGYRGLRIIGWAFFAIACVGFVLSFNGNIDQSFGAKTTVLVQVLRTFGGLMTPLFLVASYAVVLNAKQGFKRLIILYSLFIVGIYLAFLLLYFHVAIGVVYALTLDAEASKQAVDTILQAVTNYYAFNLFIDLLLCTLVTFFINYRPKKYFQGNKIYIFRTLVALPILYELGSITLKLLAIYGVTTISPFLYPLLTTKPPMAFIIFIVMALFIKHRERYYIKKGRTHEDYQEFLDTNVNALHFSISLSTTILIVVVLDLAVLIFATLGLTVYTADVMGITSQDQEQVYTIFISSLSTINGCGFGQTVPMILIIPLVLLFNYRKTYKDKKMDTLIPIGAIGIILLIFLIGGFESLRIYLENMTRRAQENAQEGGAPSLKNLFIMTVEKIREIIH